MIALNTDKRATQLVQNVDNLYTSIKHHYTVKHAEPVNSSEHGFSFGIHPIKEHSIKFSPYNGGKASLHLYEVKQDLIVKIFGKKINAIIEEEKLIRKEKGNDEANKYHLKLKKKADKFFDTDAVVFKVESYGLGKITADVNIETLDNDVLEAISTLLKHTTLTPKSQHNQSYDL
jgi:hypothetical protein